MSARTEKATKINFFAGERNGRDHSDDTDDEDEVSTAERNQAMIKDSKDEDS